MSLFRMLKKLGLSIDNPAAKFLLRAGVMKNCSTIRTMGWESRNGNWYYYQKRREGERVVSEYIGSGELSNLLAQFDKLEWAKREQERSKEKQKIEALEEQRQRVCQVLDQIQDLTRAVLLVNGYHTHKGQWRKRRGS